MRWRFCHPIPEAKMEMNDRYSRHYRLSGFGEAGQARLQGASVLVVGAGGLGCPALQYLTAAGVGKIGIIDHDKIELSNLQRQVLYTTADIGLSKAEVAAEKLRLLNPEIAISERAVYLSTENAIELVEGYDVVMDCTDNFTVRYLLSDICMLLEIPLVFGAIYKYEGQLAVFNVADQQGVTTSYRHLFPQPPGPMDAPDCDEAGVLGVLPGIVGTMQATETIKLLAGLGEPLCNKLLTINLLDNRSTVLDIPRDLPEGVDFPGSLAEFEDFDYDYHCGVKDLSGQGVGPQEFMASCRGEDVLIVDVRNPGELPELPVEHLRIPLDGLSAKLGLIDRKRVIFVCQSGKRSLAARQWLQERTSGEYEAVHLEGGVIALERYNRKEENETAR